MLSKDAKSFGQMEILQNALQTFQTNYFDGPVSKHLFGVVLNYAEQEILRINSNVKINGLIGLFFLTVIPKLAPTMKYSIITFQNMSSCIR